MTKFILLSLLVFSLANKIGVLDRVDITQESQNLCNSECGFEIHPDYLCSVDDDGNSHLIINNVNDNYAEINIPVPRTQWNIVCKDLVNGGLQFSLFNPENYSLRSYDNLVTLDDLSECCSRNIEDCIVTNPNVYPFKSTGYLIYSSFVYNNETGNIDVRSFRASSFLVGPNIIATAGHCVFSDRTSIYEDENGIEHDEYDDGIFNPTFPDEIIFYPAKNLDNNPYGGIVITKIYLENYYYTSQTKDWACCKLGSSVGNTTGWYTILPNFYQNNYSIKSFGYPGVVGLHMVNIEGIMTFFEDNGWYYRTNLEIYGGHSGGPMLVTTNGSLYACGIATYRAATYTGGIRFDSFMYNFIRSFSYSRTTNFCNMEVTGKNGSTWHIRITNCCSFSIDLYYNTKMCFESNALNWSGLNNVSQPISLSPNGYANVNISENWFATHVVCSFVTDCGHRWITAGKNLNSQNNTLTLQYATI